MSWFGVRLFTYLQGAEFYRALHVAAVQLLPSGQDRSWLDVGCGPGLLTRLAAERGYVALGIDRSARMITAAKALIGKGEKRTCFMQSDIVEALSRGQRYDVVSASSLVVATADPVESLARLETLLKPGGRLLVIEASPEMSVTRAARVLLLKRLGRRGYMILAWSLSRSARTLPDRLFTRTQRPARRHPLLEGLVNAWLFDKQF